MYVRIVLLFRVFKLTRIVGGNKWLVQIGTPPYICTGVYMQVHRFPEKRKKFFAAVRKKANWTTRNNVGTLKTAEPVELENFASPPSTAMFQRQNIVFFKKCYFTNATYNKRDFALGKRRFKHNFVNKLQFKFFTPLRSDRHLYIE